MLKAAGSLFGRKLIRSMNTSSPLLNVSKDASVIRNHTSSGSSFRAKASFPIFKSKAALIISPCMPKFVKNDSGTFIINKRGSVMLRFMPSISTMKYDYSKSQVFALHPTEVGHLISLGPRESCEFLHDPSMKSSFEGQVKKRLTVKPELESGKGGYVFSLSVNNAIEKTSEHLSLRVTKAEFTVMCTTFNFALPYIIGWDRVVAPEFEDTRLISQEREHVPTNPDDEWNK